MKIIAEPHTHTIASGHAFSTLRENAAACAKHDILFLANTDHAGLYPGAPLEIYFHTQIQTFPNKMEGVYLLKGCEVNIRDYDGSLDLSDKILERLDWVIASMHSSVLAPQTITEHTRAWLAVARNPLVDVIGHSGDGKYQFDYEPAIKEFAKYGKIVEINTHSFLERPGSDVNCETIARLCKKYSVPVVVSTDAHCDSTIGNHSAGIELLTRINFPEELILNANAKRFADVMHEKCGRKFDC
jgi:putative hydrolase